MTQRGQTIRLFLVNGNPSGLIIAEVGGWTGKVMVIPRNALPAFLRRPEAQNVAVYILSGPDPNDAFRSLVYVGESETIGRRLREHDADETKDFFDRAIIFISKDENLTRSHVRHLEQLLTSRIREASRTTLMHTNQPGGATLPEMDISDMQLYYDQIEVILPVLGLDILRPVAVVAQRTPANTSRTTVELPSTAPSPGTDYVFHVGLANARAVENNGEWIVKANSIARDAEAPTIPRGYKALRDQLKADGTLVPGELQTLRFTRDVPFASTSAAAAVVYGANISGPQNWKLGSDQGPSYAEVRETTLRDATIEVEGQLQTGAALLGGTEGTEP